MKILNNQQKQQLRWDLNLNQICLVPDKTLTPSKINRSLFLRCNEKKGVVAKRKLIDSQLQNDIKTEIIRLLKSEKMTMSQLYVEVQKKYECSEMTIWRYAKKIIKENNELEIIKKIYNKAKFKEKQLKIIELWKKGERDVLKLSRTIGCSDSSIYRIIKINELDGIRKYIKK